MGRICSCLNTFCPGVFALTAYTIVFAQGWRGENLIVLDVVSRGYEDAKGSDDGNSVTRNRDGLPGSADERKIRPARLARPGGLFYRRHFESGLLRPRVPVTNQRD